jgi:sulfhydrogenase subunit beta (sulfur reductase)
MAKRAFKKTELIEVLNRLRERYRLYAPVRQGDITSYGTLASGDQADFTAVNTRLSPKSIIYPQSDCMFAFSADKTDDQAGILREVEKDLPPTVVFGIRPCDAKAFQLVDLNFNTPEYQDPWWIKRRQTTALVGLACNRPCSTCFCTSVGSGPFSTDGLDLLLIDLGDELVAEVVTTRGAEVLEEAGIRQPATEAMTDKALALQAEAEQSIGATLSTANLKEQDLTALFNAPFWDEVQFACINCGVCTFVCPTCWCFDVQDEVRGNQGVRLRNWDACMFPLFTLHGSGHNPRSQKLQRVRQRFMHKLKYFVDKYNQGVACVGCGRCVQQCPVNIDIRQLFRLMNDFKG